MEDADLIYLENYHLLRAPLECYSEDERVGRKLAAKKKWKNAQKKPRLSVSI